jgi:hypothetical protein
MKRYAIALALVASVAFAATHTASWTAPTTNTDGSTISVPLTYNVYEGAKSAEVKTQTGVTSLSATVTGPCVLVSAVENGNEGALSNEVCLQIPNAPTNLKVQ